MNGHASVVELLLQHGADVIAICSDNENNQIGCHRRMLRSLADVGVTHWIALDMRRCLFFFKDSVLVAAVGMGHVNVVCLLCR